MTVRLPPPLERAIALSFLSFPPPVLRTIVGPPRVSPDGLLLDVQVQALLWLIEAMRVPQLASGAVATARRNMERSAPVLDVPRTPDVATYDRFVPGASGPLLARVYIPRGTAAAAPALAFFHGGGWVIGSILTHDGICRALARDARVVVVSIDYRLAPDHPFPAGREDAITATRWILANAGSLGVDSSRVAVGGDSAGGNLAALTAQALRGDKLRPAFQLLAYPATDLTRSQPSHQLFRDGYFLDRASIGWYLQHYAPDPVIHTDPRASPLFAGDLSGLPPAFVVTAGFDPLRDEGRAYAEKMRAAGVPTEYACVDGAVHGILSMAGALRAGAHMLELTAVKLREGLLDRAY
jgi:acetyl esterase